MALGSVTKGSRDPYRAAHYEIRKARGRASGYRCIDCGGRAYDWSLKPLSECRGTLAVSRVSDDADSPAEARWFSDDVLDYRPRCRLDHVRADLAERRAFTDRWERVLDERLVYGPGAEW